MGMGMREIDGNLMTSETDHVVWWMVWILDIKYFSFCGNKYLILTSYLRVNQQLSLSKTASLPDIYKSFIFKHQLWWWDCRWFGYFVRGSSQLWINFFLFYFYIIWFQLVSSVGWVVSEFIEVVLLSSVRVFYE